MGQRTYARIDPQCTVVIERADVEWSSDIQLLMPEMKMNLITTLVYVYHGQTGNWPVVVDDKRLKILDATKEDGLYLQRCKEEFDKRDGIAAPAPIARVRVRPAPPIATTEATPTAPVRVRRREFT